MDPKLLALLTKAGELMQMMGEDLPPEVRKYLEELAAAGVVLGSSMPPGRAGGLTAADVERMLREHEERRRIIAANADRPGMTPDLAAYLEQQPVGTVRTFLARMGSGAADSRARIAPTDTKALGEAFAIARMSAIMGANPALVGNVRARMAEGKPVGVLTPARQAEVRALRGPGAADRRAN